MTLYVGDASWFMVGFSMLVLSVNGLIYSFKHSGLKTRLKLIIVQIKTLKDFAVKMFFSETYLIKHLTLPELQ